MKVVPDRSAARCMESGVALARALRRRELSVVELVEAHLARIAKLDPKLRAYVHVDEEGARAAARRLDDELAAGYDRGPLHGLPVAIKDTIDVAGLPTTAASAALSHEPADADALVVARLRAAGAVILGKTNTWELGCGVGELQTRATMPEARHPIDAARFTGGSSSGSAVAVAAGLAVIAVGADTGGSIRSPAAACGIVGMKPTHGLVPLDGVLRHSSTLDHVGPLARTVEDTRRALAAMIGPQAAIDSDPGHDGGGFRIGVPVELGRIDPPLEVEVAGALDSLVERALACGLEVREVVMGAKLARWREVLAVIAGFESAAVNGALLGQCPDRLSPSVQQWLLESTRITPEAYHAAIDERAALVDRLDRVWPQVDAMLLPSAFHRVPLASDERGRMRYGLESPNAIFNVTGDPAVSIPMGFDSDGLPLAAQIAMPDGQDFRLLSLASLLSF